MKVYIVLDAHARDDVEEAVHKVFARRDDADRYVREGDEAWNACFQRMYGSPPRRLDERGSFPDAPEFTTIVEREVVEA